MVINLHNKIVGWIKMLLWVVLIHKHGVKDMLILILIEIKEVLLMVKVLKVLKIMLFGLVILGKVKMILNMVVGGDNYNLYFILQK